MQNHSIENTLTEVYENLSRSCSEQYQECEDRIRTSPMTSVLIAAGIGYFLNFLPIVSLVAGVGRVFLFLIRPAIFVFGALKLIDFIRNQPSSAKPTEDVCNPVIDSPAGPS